MFRRDTTRASSAQIVDGCVDVKDPGGKSFPNLGLLSGAAGNRTCSRNRIELRKRRISLRETTRKYAKRPADTRVVLMTSTRCVANALADALRTLRSTRPLRRTQDCYSDSSPPSQHLS